MQTISGNCGKEAPPAHPIACRPLPKYGLDRKEMRYAYLFIAMNKYASMEPA